MRKLYPNRKNAEKEGALIGFLNQPNTNYKFKSKDFHYNMDLFYNLHPINKDETT